MLVWTIAILLSAPARAQSREDYCGDLPRRALEQPGTDARTSRYVNKTYGYSVNIPVGLQAFTSASGPERGFIIALSQDPRAYLRVDASYDAFYDITAEGVHRRDLNTIRLHDTLLGDVSSEVALAREPARRFVVQMRCRGGGDVVVHEEIIAVRNREIYRLDLQSTPQRFDDDERQLNAMLKSWRWEALQ
jgi:hypothetical protein